MTVGKLQVIDHPLIQHKITLIRDKTTGPKDFRDLVGEWRCSWPTRSPGTSRWTRLRLRPPSAPPGMALSGKKVGIVAILRAGLGMVDGVLRLIPAAKVGHIGVYRDPATLKPVEYYCKLPSDVAERQLIMLDPMLATGGSACAAIGFAKQYGATSIKLVNLIAAPEGIELVQKTHPDVDIYVAAVDECLNSHGYIVPGLGDAGDRLFGTK